MPVIPVPPSTPPPPVTALGIVTSAMLEINTLAAGEAPSGAETGWGLEKLQRLIDKLNAIRQMIYAVTFTEFTLIANHAPHTIGPGGDFDVPYRPVTIPSANFILNPGQGTNEVDSPWIHIQDYNWWAALPTKQLTSSVVTDLYYDPQVPLGNLNFWPICNVANPVRLEMWTALAVPVSPSTNLFLPQGYWDGIVTALAFELCSSYGKEPSPSLTSRARTALQIMMANNAHPPKIRTDNSMPSPNGGWGRPDFDFLTGLNDN